eukprot:2094291-Rhodomonas_salina.2
MADLACPTPWPLPPPPSPLLALAHPEVFHHPPLRDLASDRDHDPPHAALSSIARRTPQLRKTKTTCVGLVVACPRFSSLKRPRDAVPKGP